MNFEFLLQHRAELCRASRLANLAHAYQWVGNFAWKVAWLGVTGEVVLRGPNEEAGRPHAVFLAQDFSQSVAEEHFLPEEIDELHAVLTSVHDAGPILEMKFRLENLGDIYRPVLRRVLEMADVLPRQQPSAALDEDKSDAA